MILNVVKRPIPVQAIQWTGSNYPEIVAFCGKIASLSNYESEAIFVDSLEGRVRGKVGDYIMRGIKGEFYICEKAIFEESYRGIDVTTNYVLKGGNLEEVIVDLALAPLGIRQSQESINWYEISREDFLNHKFLLVVEAGVDFDGHKLRKGFSLGVCNLTRKINDFVDLIEDKPVTYALLSDPDGFFICPVDKL